MGARRRPEIPKSHRVGSGTDNRAIEAEIMCNNAVYLAENSGEFCKDLQGRRALTGGFFSNSVNCSGPGIVRDFWRQGHGTIL
jgi:hypothetical protein